MFPRFKSAHGERGHTVETYSHTAHICGQKDACMCPAPKGSTGDMKFNKELLVKNWETIIDGAGTPPLAWDDTYGTC